MPVPSPNPLSPGPAGFPVIMVCDPIPALPKIDFPTGYSIRLMTEADIPMWTSIEKEAEAYFEIGDELFLSEFGSDLPFAWNRCHLVTTEDDEAVGTISAWENRTRFGSLYGQLHWLAIRPGHSQRGLAKAATSFVMDLFQKHYSRVFLETQSLRLPAIHLYRSFGFQPLIQSDHDHSVWQQIEQAEKTIFS